ncbi:transcriptional regulator family: Fungal Specific TF [Paecilomyces variotii]|nr:transcriptional regulator family: Fungal Specific TF [Paecilomyces variotii]
MGALDVKRVGSSVMRDDPPAPSPNRKSNGSSISPPSMSTPYGDNSTGSPASRSEAGSEEFLLGLNDGDEIPESKSRRLLELQLLQNYLTKLSQPFPQTPEADGSAVWPFLEVPQMALQHDNLLYAMFSISATHLLRTQPNNAKLLAARQTYLGLALRKQREAVSQLSGQNADAVCFASTLILIDAFATLEGRDITPYLPPMEWLHMGRGAATVFTVAMKSGLDSEMSKIMSLIDAPPVSLLDNENTMFAEKYWKDFRNLLRDDIGGGYEDLSDMETLQAYQRTLSFIGSVHHAVMDGEPIHPLCRRLMAFSPLIPRKFIDFVEERRPRALVILAHYFALASKVRSAWWMGKTPEREIRAIMMVLPPEWQEHMHWPLAMTGLIPG